MAKRIVHLVTDDLNGRPGAAEVSFGLDGTDYTVDLTGPNYKKLRKALEPYVQAARRVPRRRATTAVVTAKNRAVLRAWARKNGWPNLGTHGRIPEEAYDAFFAAQRGWKP